MNQNATEKPVIDETALKQYTAILGYFQYESTVFWTRNQLFLVANAALLGLAGKDIPVTIEGISWARLYTLAIFIIAALYLSYLWHQAISTGEWWIALWTEKLQALEAAAFGNFKFHRDIPRNNPAYPNYVSAKKVARQTAWLFVIVWGLALVYIAFLAVAKYQGWIVD